MKRREFITIVGGAATWPLASRAQQREQMRRVGILTPFPADDAEGQERLTAFAQALQQAGWTLGQNLRLDYRWGNGAAETMRKYAAELAALALDVILANSSASVSALLQVTRTIPIVVAWARLNPPWRLVRQVGSTAAAHRVTTTKSVPSPVSSPRL